PTHVHYSLSFLRNRRPPIPTLFPYTTLFRSWTARLRVEPRGIEVAELGYKWGAATPEGRVRIHWAAMQLRPELVEYVLAHELAQDRKSTRLNSSHVKISYAVFCLKKKKKKKK